MAVCRSITNFYRLAKPGIVYGNDLAFVAGFGAALASTTSSWSSFFGSLIGISLVMGSSCVVNNMIDRDIDARMGRTKRRELVQHAILLRAAGIYMLLLLSVGLALLAVYGGWLAAGMSIFGWVMYGIVYTKLKRHTRHATLIGTIPGSLPIVIGYVSAGGSLDLLVTTLFIAMAGWQMTHFYAIALFRNDDYHAAKIPTTPQTKGIDWTVREMQIYAIVFAVFAIAAGVWLSVWYLIVSVAIGGRFIKTAFQTTDDTVKWSRAVFRTSLLVLLAWTATVASAAVLR
ncbi:MAG: heme o synthase [Candidatus Saccharimonadales bacterium]